MNKEFSEDFLYFVWETGFFDTGQLYTTDGLEVLILKRGTRNLDSGPDFINAKIKIGDTVWCGNVEIHFKSSDWYKHNHNKDIIGVCLTGSPKNFGYSTKSDFLAKFPMVKEVSISDPLCKYLVTDSYDSESSKMKNAKKKGIKIVTYGDFSNLSI